ncbi:MAG: helix-turn-helix transcriptional regulator [Eubacterium sp.]|nr:helix-turn-helix transcriptional regulator [Eubacterium sp.]MBR2189974.1 helix-turn-helix transcriptional regulator [Eubacterium sp.]
MKIYWYNGSKNLIGPAVKKLRVSRKMTQVALAEQMQLRGVEIGPLVILRIEKGLRFVTDYEVRALADVFRVSLDDLYPEKLDFY